jgi:U3 small nucleolar RNA-associated protein 21
MLFIISGQDSTLRSFSVVHDKHNKSLGRASYDKKESKKMGLKKDKYMMSSISQFASGKAYYIDNK